MKFLKKGNTLRAFTLTELIVAVLIGSLVLSILMSFISTSMNEITYSNKQTNIIEKVNTFSTSLNNYKWAFVNSEILIDKTWTWSDVVMMVNPEESEWILLGVVRDNTLSLEETSADYEKIYEKYLWIRQLTASDIVTLRWNPMTAYDLNFNKDKLFQDVFMKNFQAQLYNSWAILDTDLDILINYKDWINGQKWDEITNDWIYSVNIIF